MTLNVGPLEDDVAAVFESYADKRPSELLDVIEFKLLATSVAFDSASDCST